MNKNELLKKVAYLTDNMNKKVRKFRENGNGDFYENQLNYATAKFDKKINLTMESGFLTKSKKELGKLSENDLGLLYERLQKLNTNEKFGTVQKFKKFETNNMDKTASSLKSLLGEEKYNKLKGNKSDSDFVKEFIERKKEFSNSRGKVYSSNQVLNDMYLSLPNLSEEDMQDTQRAIAKIERGRELLERNDKMRKEGRQPNGNR